MTGQPRSSARRVAAVGASLTIVLALAAPSAAWAGRSTSHRPHRAESSGSLPVADENYQYAQLYFMSSNYLMRYSGQDGPPGDLNPADGNLPPQLNGWQEFYLHWKQQVTSPKVMGAFAKDLHVDDHNFQQATASFFGPPPPYQSDVRTVTIPGAKCPGQTVLIAGHPDSTTLLNTGNGSAYDDTSGITMGMAELRSMTKWWTKHHTWPARTFRVAMFDGEEEGLYGSYYYASHLIPPGPQGKIVLVANMDQNGMEYPAHPAGSQQTTFGSGFWYTNVNASPLKDFSIYSGSAHVMPTAFKRNLSSIKHFRAVLAASVRKAFVVLGARYHHRIPLENPIEGGKTIPAYVLSDIKKFTPVQDDTLGRTDQVPFVQQGIPGYGIVGAFDSDATDNPLEKPNSPLTPLGANGIPQIAGYDTPRDNMTHFNLMASGTTGGPLGQTGSVELRRALELPMTWTLYLIARPEYVGGVPHPTKPVAYFEALPTAAKPGRPVSLNGAITAANGHSGLHYAWDFGDGSHGNGAVVKHTYAKAGWYLAKLGVKASDGATSGYEQLIKVGHPSGHRPASNRCGLLSAAALHTLTKGLGGSSSGSGSAGNGSNGSNGSKAGGGSGSLASSGLSPVLAPTGLAVLATALVLARRRRTPSR
ncbi:MAG: M28 family peptidase [Frankiales bacterium]|nr:M28 family peptidase [Frankiales bacterium]